MGRMQAQPHLNKDSLQASTARRQSVSSSVHQIACKNKAFPAPNWVLRTAIGPASLAGQLAVRSTGAQH